MCLKLWHTIEIWRDKGQDVNLILATTAQQKSRVILEQRRDVRRTRADATLQFLSTCRARPTARQMFSSSSRKSARALISTRSKCPWQHMPFWMKSTSFPRSFLPLPRLKQTLKASNGEATRREPCSDWIQPREVLTRKTLSPIWY